MNGSLHSGSECIRAFCEEKWVQLFHVTWQGLGFERYVTPNLGQARLWLRYRESLGIHAWSASSMMEGHSLCAHIILFPAGACGIGG